MAEETDPGRAEKALGFARRVRRAPNTVDEVAARTGAAQATLAEVQAALDRLEELAHAIRSEGRAGVTAVGDELGRKQHHLDQVLDRLDGTVAAHAAALHRAVAAPARAAAARALHEQLGPPPALRRGLSIFTLCWEHGGLLASSVASGLEVLDSLPTDEQGQLLILDDASTDSTPRVAAELEAADPRVRVIRSETNLGLARARTALLHAAETSHAFQLDADNTAVVSGVIDLYRVAVDTGATVTYGNVIQIDVDDVVCGPISNEPPTPALFASNYVDTMAVSDVAAYRTLGGWPTDPLLEHADDWAALHHVVEAGLLVAFVPTLVGRYGQLSTGFHHTVPDPRIATNRVARVYDPTGRRSGPDPMAGVHAVAVHPATGPLWATPEAIAANAALAPPPLERPEPATPSRRVLVIASGGVANLGDDAITVRGLDRVRAALGDDVAIDLLTDGPTPPPGRGPVRWLGPTVEVLAGLRREELGPLDGPLARVADARRVGEGRWRPLDPSLYDAAFVLGGGSLTSGWSDGLIAPRAVLAAVLRTAGVPYACSGQGIGPLDTDDDRTMVAGLLAGAVAVSCRDEASAELARALPGVDAARVTVTGDDALGLAGQPDESGRPDGPVLGVTLRRADYVGDPAQDPVRAWALAVDAIAAARGWGVLGIALNTQPPEPEIATLAALRATTPFRAPWHIVECGTDPRQLVHLVGGVQAMAAQSYHAALFALAAGIPAVLGAASPYYRDKAEGLARLGGLPPTLAVTDPEGMAPALDAVSAALASGGRPLDRATAAVDAWWASLPACLGVASG